MSSAATDALTERLFTAAVASFDLAGVYIGHRLGWYASLDADGPATRLEQQAVAGILAVDDGGRF